MAQHDYVIANQSGASFRADLNNGLAAIVSNNSGASAPSTTFAFQWWADTTNNLLKMRNAANDGWITIRQLDGEYDTIGLENGTAAAPSLFFAGSGTDTGLFSGGADQVNVSTGGTERAEFGTAEVVFNDGGADYDFRVEGDSNTNLVVVDASVDSIGIGTNTPGTLIEIDNAAPYVTFKNNTEEDTDGGRESRLIFEGEQSGGEISTLAQIEVSHDGTADDEKGKLIISTNDGSDGATPTAAVTIDSAQRLLAGTSSTSADVRTIFQARSGDTSGHTNLLLASGSSSPADGAGLGFLTFSDSGHTSSAWIHAARDGGTWSASSKPTRTVFSTTADGASSPTERLRITSDGTLQLRSSPGIDFSQIQTETAATGASMTSEVLDSYEEGTWTPYFTSSGATTPFESDITSAYARQNGRYTKIGRQVFFEAWLRTAATWNYQNGGANGQDLGIAGLPFVQNNAEVYAPISVGYFSNWSTSWPASYTPMGYVENNTSHIRLTYAAQSSIDQILTTNIAVANSDIIFTGVYTVA